MQSFASEYTIIINCTACHDVILCSLYSLLFLIVFLYILIFVWPYIFLSPVTLLMLYQNLPSVGQ